MVKINTFSMAVSKTYCLFHFQTEICFLAHLSRRLIGELLVYKVYNSFHISHIASIGRGNE